MSELINFYLLLTRDVMWLAVKFLLPFFDVINDKNRICPTNECNSILICVCVTFFYNQLVESYIISVSWLLWIFL